MLKRIVGVNICFDCKKACGGCSWSKDFEPVPGWIAEECYIPIVEDNLTCHIETYHITACPQFEPDRRMVVDMDE